MKTKLKASAVKQLVPRLIVPVGSGLILTFMLMLTLVAASGIFSKLATEAVETGSTVVWYVEAGHWREDVEIYLAHAENVFCSSSAAASKLSLEEDDE